MHSAVCIQDPQFCAGLLLLERIVARVLVAPTNNLTRTSAYLILAIGPTPHALQSLYPVMTLEVERDGIPSVAIEAALDHWYLHSSAVNKCRFEMNIVRSPTTGHSGTQPSIALTTYCNRRPAM